MLFVFGILIMALKLIVGVGLVWNCGRGLFSGEGMYDSDSRNTMVASQILGVVFGLVLLTSLLGLFDIPYVPFI